MITPIGNAHPIDVRQIAQQPAEVRHDPNDKLRRFRKVELSPTIK